MADKETMGNCRIGQGKPGPGRPKGRPNRATRDVRAVFSALVEANAEKAQELFDRVAAKDPAKALDLLVRLAEFVIPKLARTDHRGDVADKTPTVIQIVGVEPSHDAGSKNNETRR